MSELLSADFSPNPLDKPGYILEFHDEFEGNSLDQNKWLPYYLPQWSSRLRSAPNYYMADSELILQITQDQQPWCPQFDGEVKCSSIQTGLYAGAVGSKIGQHQFNKNCIVTEAQTNIRKYTPQYGFFEIRAKGPATSANLASLWMIGYEDTPDRSGEIAVFEIVGAHAEKEASTVRYGIHPWNDPELSDEFYEEVLPLNTAQYHIYAVEWTPTQVDFYVDNLKIKTIGQSPNYPMQFMLGLYEIPVSNAWTGSYDPTTPYPKEFVIDYFRAYHPVGGYRV